MHYHKSIVQVLLLVIPKIDCIWCLVFFVHFQLHFFYIFIYILVYKIMLSFRWEPLKGNIISMSIINTKRDQFRIYFNPNCVYSTPIEYLVMSQYLWIVDDKVNKYNIYVLNSQSVRLFDFHVDFVGVLWSEHNDWIV